ncbi:hypothetical protein N9K24_04885 [Amylibacter sp.]|nr:hypothetical protein [Amylibacter sp.]
MFNKTISNCVIATASVFTTPVLADRDQMKIVGSSTVFPLWPRCDAWLAK